MKRHKYTLVKHIRRLTPVVQHWNLSFCYFKGFNNLPVLAAVSTLLLKEYYFPNSKVAAYCVITGRVRFTIGLVYYSRHMFFEKNSQAQNTGFFMSSW